MAVLGFGDRSFPAYCAFAKAVAAAAQAKGWPELLPLDTIDRQSPQDFARWGRALGEALGISLELVSPARLAAHRDIDPRLAARLRGRDAGGGRDPALRPAARDAVAAADRARASRGSRRAT